MLTALVERGRSKCELYFPLGEEGETKSALFSDGTSFQGIIEEHPKESNARLYCTQFSFSEEASLVQLEQKDSIQWGSYIIKYLSKENLGECIIRKLEVTNEDDSLLEKRLLLHYWYPNWADHKLANPEQVLQIALHVLELNSDVTNSATDSSSSTDDILNSSSSSNIGGAARVASKPRFECENFHKPGGSAKQEGSRFNFEPEATKVEEASINCPIVAHCSAGIGRTGCFLAILNGIHQLRINFNVDILAIVCSLRLNRGGMVQTAEQYELIHRVLSLYTDLL